VWATDPDCNANPDRTNPNPANLHPVDQMVCRPNILTPTYRKKY